MKPFDFTAMARKCRKPSINAVASVFWRDPYISAHVLNAHLDPDSDAGSRPPWRITEETRWVVTALDMNRFKGQSRDTDPPCLLDLGCGPGLYAREFASHGLRVVGMDYSPASIEYARRENQRSSQCEFYLCDFSKAALPGHLHGAAMIYGIFGNLSEKQRDAVLKRLHRALPVGGRFVFDVFGESWARRHALKDEWFISLKDGFWMPKPHLVLERSWYFDAARTVLNGYHVVDEQGEVTRHVVRHRWYTEDELPSILLRNGFVSLKTHRVDEDWLFVVAEKQ